MIRLHESPTETAHRLIRELSAALARSGRVPGVGRWSFAESLGGDRFSINVARDVRPAHARDAADLPADLRTARPSLRSAYRAIRALRDQGGAAAGVWPADVVAWLDAKGIDPPNSVDTVNHALRDLRTLKLARSDPETGWHLDATAERNRQTPTPTPTAYTSRAADAGVRRFTGRLGMASQRIWVPAEEADGVVFVRDVVTDREVPVTDPGRVGAMKVTTASGRLSAERGVRCELLSQDGRRALVKLPGGEKVTVRVLGPWQLDGRAEPDAADLGDSAA